MVRWILLSVIGLSLAVSASVAGVKEKSISNAVLTIDAASEAAHHIRLASAYRTKTAGSVAATASVEPDANGIAQITTRIPARVVKLLASPGDTIKSGQPLAILSSIEMGEAKAEYLKTRSLEAIAAQNLKREKDLYAKQISSLKDLLAARAAHDTAQAQYEAARDKLTLLIPSDQLARVKWSHKTGSLSDFPLTSPIQGTLVRRDLIVGEAVASDRPLMTVINLDKVWVNTNIYESDLSAVQIGDRATIQAVAYPDRNFEGHVFYIADEVDRRTRAVLARIEVPNPNHLLKPGMFAHVLIEGGGGSHEAVAVPASAVFGYQGGKIVFIAVGPNRYQARSVVLGGETASGVEILTGLAQGEKVVTNGGLALKGLLINQGSR